MMCLRSGWKGRSVGGAEGDNGERREREREREREKEKRERERERGKREKTWYKTVSGLSHYL